MDAAIKTQPDGLLSFPEYFERGGEPFDTAGHAPLKLNPKCLCAGPECAVEFAECFTLFSAYLENERFDRERMAGAGAYPDATSCPRGLCMGVCRCKEDINL